MSDTRYNGWSNYETWVVNLWIDNDQGSYNYWHERARECFTDAQDKDEAAQSLAKELESEHEESKPECTGVFSDLMSHAFGMVDWLEIAISQIDALDIVTCALCGKQMLEDDADYIGSESDKPRPYCEECALIDEQESDEEELEEEQA